MLLPFRHAEAQVGFTDRGHVETALSVETKKMSPRRCRCTAHDVAHHVGVQQIGLAHLLGARMRLPVKKAPTAGRSSAARTSRSTMNPSRTPVASRAAKTSAHVPGPSDRMMSP